MKAIVCSLLLSCVIAVASAQNFKSDSLAYQLQRQKINNMLDMRRQKFGEYDQSLTMHTGIFGLQTKKDIRRSNDILMEIVRTDDEIFRQLKILLDYRTFEQKQVQSQSADIEKYSVAYMNTINRLRNQVDTLKKEAEKQKQEQTVTTRTYIIVIILMALVLLILVFKKRSND